MFKLDISNTEKFKLMVLGLTITAYGVLCETVSADSNISLDHQLSLTVTNPLNINRSEETLVILKEHLTPHFNFNAFKVYLGTTEIVSQSVDTNGNGINDQLIFNAHLNALEQKNFTIKYALEGSLVNKDYTKRTHAELSINKGGILVDGKYRNGKFVPVQHQQIPADHVVGDLQFKYEGPGWESDKIGYRLYFDYRNIIDIFGKKTPDIVLPQVGQPGTNYHKDAPWGMDILKVGDSLGIGGIGMMSEGKVYRVDTADNMTITILDDGPLQSRLQIKHDNWALADSKYDLSSELSINAGSRLTHNKLIINNNATNLTTGIVKHQPSQTLISTNKSDNWGYIATFGRQSYVGDELGMAIFYKQSSLIRLDEDKNNHLVIMKPENGHLDYYFLGTWAQDPDAIKTKDAFRVYLDNKLSELNQPLRINKKCQKIKLSDNIVC